MITLRFNRSIAGALLLAAGLVASSASRADYLSGFFDLTISKVENWIDSPNGALKWNQFDRMELERRANVERGTPNQHPVQATPEQVTAALATIQYKTARGNVIRLFSDEALQRLAMAVSAGLGAAKPEHDIVFTSSGPIVENGFTRMLTTSGRMFYVDGKLNVLVGEVGRDVLAEVQATQSGQLTVNFPYGSRAKPSKGVTLAGVTSGDGKQIREDWIAVTVPGAVVGTPPAGKVAAGAAAVAAPTAETAATKAEARFKTLKRLHDQGLISDAEFEKKRTELLKEL